MKTKTIILTIILMMASTISQFFGTDNNHHPEFNESSTINGMVYAYPPPEGIFESSQNTKRESLSLGGGLISSITNP